MIKAKDIVTLYVCTNATRTDKVPLSMIGRAKKARCFRNHAKNLIIIVKPRLGLIPKLFKSGGNDFSTTSALRPSIQVFSPLIIVDHGAELVDPNSKVSVHFLPPNCTSVFQPMDAGVIAMVKKNYCYCLLY